MVGPGRFELPTSRLSGVRSNQLSYGPLLSKALEAGTEAELYLLLMPAIFMNHIINKPIIHRPLICSEKGYEDGGWAAQLSIFFKSRRKKFNDILERR